MLIGSRYLNARDYDSVTFRALADECRSFYRGKPHPYGARNPEAVRIHVTREWEYPFALLAAEAMQGDRILDLGCGGSPLPIMFAWYGCDVVGLDRNDVTMGPASLRAYGSKRLPIPIVCADLTAPLPFRAESFDVVTCISTLESLPGFSPMAALTEVSRVLRSGGRFVVTLDVDREGTDRAHIAEWLDAVATDHTEELGLRPYGPVNMCKPDLRTLSCAYHVFGAVLEKV